MISAERAIENLISRYAFLIDDGDVEGLGELLDRTEFRLGAVTAHGAAEVAILANAAPAQPGQQHSETAIRCAIPTETGRSRPRSPVPRRSRAARRR